MNPTPPTTKIHRAINDALTATHRIRACMVVTGRTGIGKSTAVRRAIRDADLELVDVRLPTKASRKEVLVAMVTAASSETHLPRGEFVVLQDQLLTVLEQREAVVVIDNAELLEGPALHTLAHLHDDPSANWTLVLVGLPSLIDRLQQEPRLGSCWDVLQLDPLPRRDWISIVRTMDPLLRSAENDLLVEIDNVLCEGNLHRWKRFARELRRLADEHVPDETTLIPELASAAVDEADRHMLAPA